MVDRVASAAFPPRTRRFRPWRASTAAVALLLVLWLGCTAREERSHPFSADAGAVRKMAAAPRKIFIDLGANCGNSYLVLKTKMNLLDSNTNGNEDDDATPWDVYLWEANPQLVRLYLNDLASKQRLPYDTGTDRIHVVAAAAAAVDGELQFYLTQGQEGATDKQDFRNPDCDIDSGSNPAGASTLMEGAVRAGKPVTVPAIDFARWLSELKLQPEDRVLLKIDIEGAEVEVLERLMAHNNGADLCRVERLLVEWHAFIFTDDPELRAKHEEFRTNFPSRFRELCHSEVPLEGWH